MHVTCCGRFMRVLRVVCFLKVGYLSNKRAFWVVVERNCIHFTTHFIECLVVETNRFVSSTVNVILTRQTSGQRSSRAAQSKRRALDLKISFPRALRRYDLCSWSSHTPLQQTAILHGSSPRNSSENTTKHGPTPPPTHAHNSSTHSNLTFSNTNPGP